MKKEAIEYVQNQINRSEDRLRPYVFATPTFTHPERHVVIRIKKYVEAFLRGNRDSRWVVVPGLRGVGKTTAMAQVFLTSKRTTQKSSFLYIAVDDLITRGLTLNDAIDAYEYLLGKPFERIDFPVLLFIDEVQQDPNWAAVLKSLHDRGKGSVFLFCTGSSAVSLQSNPDVARRAKFEKLYPLSFGEYEMLKNNIFPSPGLKEKIKEGLYGSSSAEEAYGKLKPLEAVVARQWSRFDRSGVDEYLLNGTLPFTLNSLTPNVYDGINILLDRIIDKDIKELGQFDTPTLSAIKRLLYIMADSGDSMSINKVSQIIDLSNNTIRAILDALERAELIIKVPAQGSNVAQAKKPSKYLFMSPALRSALLNVSGVQGTYNTRKGKYLEDIAGLHFYREFIAPRIGFLTYDPSQGSADFILQIADQRQIAFEMGLGNKGFAQVKKTMASFKMDFGVVVCSTDLILSREDNVLKLPLDYFLLM